MNVKVEIDLDGAYSEMTPRDKEEFVDDHIEDATDNAIIKQVINRQILGDILESYKQAELNIILQGYGYKLIE